MTQRSESTTSTTTRATGDPAPPTAPAPGHPAVLPPAPLAEPARSVSGACGPGPSRTG